MSLPDSSERSSAAPTESVSLNTRSPSPKTRDETATRIFSASAVAPSRFVSGLEKVEVGDYVLTTGQDGIYPAGLNVGEVIEVKHGTATQPHVIYVRPSARLDQLEHVAVLRYHPPQRPAPDQSLPNLDKSKK